MIFHCIEFFGTDVIGQGLADVVAKKKSDVKKGALAALETELLEDTKMHIADSTEECQQV